MGDSQHEYDYTIYLKATLLMLTQGQLVACKQAIQFCYKLATTLLQLLQAISHF